MKDVSAFNVLTMLTNMSKGSSIFTNPCTKFIFKDLNRAWKKRKTWEIFQHGTNSVLVMYVANQAYMWMWYPESIRVTPRILQGGC